MNKVIADKRSWLEAYKSFLLDKDESILLKVAPLAVMFGAPEVIAGNLIPVVGEVIDFGSLTLLSLIALRTGMAVRKHR